MSFLSYIISSILLSCVGTAIYLVFRRMRPGLTARRGMIWLVLAVSLMLPLTPPFIQVHAPHPEPHTAPATVISPVPVGKTNINDFCHCADPHAGDVILYQASRVYDFFLRNSVVISILFGVAAFLLLLRLHWRLIRLYRLSRRNVRGTARLDGLTFRIADGPEGLAAGSLRFFGRYVFWSPALDGLTEWERNAVLYHELSHIRQRNTQEKLLLGLLGTVWFLNPAWYFLSRELELISEFRADARAAEKCGDAKAYARLLLRLKSGPVPMPAQGFRAGRLRKRVRHLLARDRRPRLQFLPAIALGIVLLFPGEVLAENLIRAKLHDIEVYEFLSKKNRETGKQEFCRKCTFEAVDAACY